MAKTRINLFGVGVGTPGKSLNVTAASRTNVYYDIQPAPGDKSQVAAFGMAGAELFATMPDVDQPVSAVYTTSSGTHSYVVQGSSLYEMAGNGTMSLLGSFASAPTVAPEMADNGVEVAIAIGTHLYILNISSASLTAVGFDGNPAASIAAYSVTFQDGYFIAATAGGANPAGFYLSNLYDGTVWNSLNYAVAEFAADDLAKVVSKNGVLYLFGTRTTEVWQNIGSSLFPFQRVAGTQNEYGLANKDSLAHVSSSMIALMVNRQNDLAVMRIEGYQVSNITPPDLAYRIKHMTSPRDCVALSYSMAGHDFYQISWADESWAYDLLSGLWSRVTSGSADRHLGKLSFLNPFYGFPLVTHYADGRIFKLDDTLHSDDGVTNHREIIGDHVFMPDLTTFRVASVSVDIEHGNAPEGGNDPLKLRLALSRDGGHNFDEEYEAESAPGAYRTFFQYNRMGRGRDIVPRLRMTEPVKFALIGAVADLVPYGW